MRDIKVNGRSPPSWTSVGEHGGDLASANNSGPELDCQVMLWPARDANFATMSIANMLTVVAKQPIVRIFNHFNRSGSLRLVGRYADFAFWQRASVCESDARLLRRSAHHPVSIAQRERMCSRSISEGVSGAIEHCGVTGAAGQTVDNSVRGECQLVAGRQDDCAFDKILQLAHVTGHEWAASAHDFDGLCPCACSCAAKSGDEMLGKSGYLQAAQAGTRMGKTLRR
jgi:hypothetical protein